MSLVWKKKNKMNNKKDNNNHNRNKKKIHQRSVNFSNNTIKI